MKIFTELNSAQTLEAVKKEYREILEYGPIIGGVVEGTLELIFALEEKLKTEKLRDQKMLDAYRDILTSLRVRSFSHFSEAKAFNFFKIHFVLACTYDAIGEVSLFGLMQHFLGRRDIMERDRLLQKMSQSVKQSSELIGNKTMSLGGTDMTPQFRNWVRDYVDVIGAGKKNVSDIREYLSLSKNARTLNRTDRAILQRALKYYELLKVPTKEIGSLGNKPLLAWGFTSSEVRGIDEDLFDVQKPDQLLEQYVTYDAFKKGIIQEKDQSQKKAIPAKSPSLSDVRPVKKNTAPERPKPIAPEEQPRPLQSRPLPPVLKNPVVAPPIPEKAPSPAVQEKSQIQHEVNTLSSADNLATFSIEDFRTFGSTDENRLEVVLSKIVNLKSTERDLLSGWQKSPLYELYLSIGRVSMTSESTVSEIGRDLFKQGKPYVTEREFEMIAEISAQF